MTSKKKRRTFVNKYAGWPSNALFESPDEIPVLDQMPLPQEFWEDHVSKRKPAIIKSHPNDPNWRATQLWTDKYLTDTAGDSKVMVEVRAGTTDTFGQGRKEAATFADCIERMAHGDSTLYLTTQEPELGPDGHPEIISPPLSDLVSDIPIRPALLGNLIPQSINIWMGRAPDGSSSGLHHDYHDNLYILLRGKKRFRLWPPSDVEAMATYGVPVLVHPNGRIVYQTQGNVLADGSDAQEVQAWKAKHEAEQEIAAAEQAVEKGESGARERLAAAEQALEDVLDAALFAGDNDDFDALIDQDMNKTTKNSASADPESFSRIDLNASTVTLKARFPSFPGVDTAIECHVEAGQCLYLPAGWFHEVTSYDDNNNDSQSSGHLALNYWMHPPDNLIGSSVGFKTPYKSSYWPELYKLREERYVSK